MPRATIIQPRDAGDFEIAALKTRGVNLERLSQSSGYSVKFSDPKALFSLGIHYALQRTSERSIARDLESEGIL